MADPQAVTATPAPAAGTSEFVRTLQDAADAMPEKPYIESRFLGGLFGDDLGAVGHVVSGAFTVDTVGAAEGVDISCGFTPKMALVANLDTFAAYAKFGTMPGEYGINLLGTPAITFLDSTLKFGNRDGGGNYPTRYLHVDSRICTDTEDYTYLIMG